MSARFWLKLAEILVPVLLAITIFVSWQADRRDRAQLAIQLAVAQQTIAQAAASQHDRDTILSQTLAQIATQKQSAVTPAQILKAFPDAISLPAPITLQSDASQTIPPAISATGSQSAQLSGTTSVGTTGVPRVSTSSQGATKLVPSNPSPKPGEVPDAIIPTADLKPLYDFAMDCKACRAKLSAVQSDLNDERTKNAALTKERDAAIQSAKGGSALRRISRAAKWFVLGAAAGAIAYKAAH
jgi:hypothetical protein